MAGSEAEHGRTPKIRNSDLMTRTLGARGGLSPRIDAFGDCMHSGGEPFDVLGDSPKNERQVRNICLRITEELGFSGGNSPLFSAVQMVILEEFSRA